MSDIFISYAREDAIRVKELVKVLEKQGWSVFWDHRIPAGKTWRSHIGSALENARCIIVIWSKFSIGSDWVNEEADEGKKRGILIPIILDSVQPPHGFREIQAADLTDYHYGQKSEIIDTLFADISLLLEQEPKPGPDKANHDSLSDNQLHVKHEKNEKPKAGWLYTNRNRIIIAIVAFIVIIVVIYFSLLIRQKPVIKKYDNPPYSGVKPAKRVDLPRKDIGIQNQNPQWFVVVGSFSLKDAREAEQMRLDKIVNSDFDLILIESKEYPLLKPDELAVVIGPFESEKQAIMMLRKVKNTYHDAFVKQCR